MIVTLKTLQKIATYETQAKILEVYNEGKIDRDQYAQMIEWWHVMKTEKQYTPEKIWENELTTWLPDGREVIVI